jgi:transcription factor A, mitochondrial
MNYATVKRLSLEEKLGLPERPKKPSSPYLQFCAQKFPEFSKMHPGSTFTGS